MKRSFLMSALRLAAVCTGLVVTTGLAGAQSQSSWPERPVRLIVPFAPGAGTDAMGRLHHANFINYFELGRTEQMRVLGQSYREFEESGLLLVVIRRTNNRY